jgi:hypothetical protein
MSDVDDKSSQPLAASAPLPTWPLIEIAIRQLRRRFPDDLDQAGGLFFDLLDRLLANAKTLGNAAVVGDETRLEEFAYDRWVDRQRRARELGKFFDQRERPLLDLNVRRLIRYWQRGAVGPDQPRKSKKRPDAKDPKFRAADLKANQSGSLSKGFGIVLDQRGGSASAGMGSFRRKGEIHNRHRRRSSTSRR